MCRVAAKSRILPRWKVLRLRPKGEEIGTVEVRGADAGIRIAIEKFEITSLHDQRWLTAKRRGC